MLRRGALLGLLLGGLGLLAARPGAAISIVPTCTVFIGPPYHLATAVPVDTTVRVSDGCASLELLTADGTAVPFDLRVSEAARELVPRAPLRPDTDYVVTARSARRVAQCDEEVEPRVEFRTGPLPRVAAVSFQFGAGPVGTLGDVEVRLSEPALAPADLLPEAGFIEITRADGGELDLEPFNVNGDLEALRYIRHPVPESTAFRIRVNPGLRFASGLTMTEPFEVTLVPVDWFNQYSPGDPPYNCAPPPVRPSGCSGD